MTEPLTRPALPRGVSSSAQLYLRPLDVAPVERERCTRGAGTGRPLAPGAGGTRLVFGAVELLVRTGGRLLRAAAPADALEAWAVGEAAPVAARVRALLERLSAPRPSLGPLCFDRPLVMGVLNVTPDSFSDGGDYFDSDAAVAEGRRMVEAAADIIDIGGESTRPGAARPSPEQERRRVLPVVRALAGLGPTLTVDTRRAEIMAAALEAGAGGVNDISALSDDPDSLALLARHDGPVVLMHMQGTPETMQQAPRYDVAPLDVYDYLEARIEACQAAGIRAERLIVDPGIGFGKTVAHNLEILRDIALFHGLGRPLLLGASRKSFIGTLSAREPAKARLPGSLAAALHAVQLGAQIVRTHDVAETRQALAVLAAIQAPQ